jgi:HEAT repeat protein
MGGGGGAGGGAGRRILPRGGGGSGYADAESEEDLIDRLINALSHEDPKVWKEALVTLRKLGPKAKKAIPALGDMLADEEKGKAHAFVINTLVAIGPESVPSLAEGVRVKSASNRSRALKALGKFGPKSKDAVPAVLEALEDKEKKIRSLAAGTLPKIGARGAEVGLALARILADEQRSVRSAASKSLSEIRIRSTEVIEAVVAHLEDSDSKIRRQAAIALGGIGKASKGALPTLKQMAEHDENSAVRMSCRRAVTRIEKSMK